MEKYEESYWSWNMLIFPILKDGYKSRFRATLLKMLWTIHEELEAKIITKDYQYK